VRAILRASRAGKVAIMFPMISTIAEWRAARDVVERERIGEIGEVAEALQQVYGCLSGMGLGS
jgi:phosphoenolpyruvate-protein kinase (PTS system EI component)